MFITASISEGGKPTGIDNRMPLDDLLKECANVYPELCEIWR